MDNGSIHRPLLWPVLFLAAFLLGLSLWSLWMIGAIKKTRRERNDNFFVPRAGQTAPPATNSTNQPSRTN